MSPMRHKMRFSLRAQIQPSLIAGCAASADETAGRQRSCCLCRACPCCCHVSTRSHICPVRRRLLIAWVVLTCFAHTPAFAQHTVRWVTNYYYVTGASIGEIHQSLARSRPWRDQSTLDGLTDWRVQWRFQIADSGGECRLSSFTTDTTITMTLPRWVRPTNTPLDVVTNWVRYINALTQHEVGHGRIGLAAAAEQQRRVPMAEADVNCNNLRNRINQLAQQIVDEHRRRDREYDERTRHGAGEGAILRGAVRRRDRPGP
jgi:predicted secreted Zn-dependent protease